MPTFEYKTRNHQGKTIAGSVEAPSEELAGSILSERGLIIVSLSSAEKGSMDISIPFLNKIKVKDIVVLSRQLSVMASANLPIVQALRVLIDQTENQELKIIVSEIADEVEGGGKLSDALARHRKVFNDFYINMVRSGEVSGNLDGVLNYLADELEKNYDLMSKIKGAMIYPIFTMSGLVVVGFVMMIFVIPKLTAVLEETGGELPFSTKILIGVSGVMSQYWWMILILGVLLFLAVKWYTNKTKQGRYILDFVKIKLPVFGNLFQKIYLVRMTRTLASLIKGGLPLTQGLEIVSDIVGNVIYKDLIDRTILEVKDGHSIATVFLKSKKMPIMVPRMMGVGEKTGQLEEVLSRLASFYTNEINNMMTNLVALIEPLIIVVMGVAIGLMVAAIVLPMYNLASSF